MSYRITTDKSWDETLRDLADTFAKWGVRPTSYRVVAIRPRLRPFRDYPLDERRVTVEFLHPKGSQQITVTKDDQSRPEDNLRAIYLALEDLRMIERRGLADIVREALVQIEAPKGESRPKRSPWQVLELNPGTSLEVVEAVYRAKAKLLHPDRGGDAEAMRELNEAYHAIVDPTPTASAAHV